MVDINLNSPHEFQFWPWFFLLRVLEDTGEHLHIGVIGIFIGIWAPWHPFRKFLKFGYFEDFQKFSHNLMFSESGWWPEICLEMSQKYKKMKWSRSRQEMAQSYHKNDLKMANNATKSIVKPIRISSKMKFTLNIFRFCVSSFLKKMTMGDHLLDIQVTFFLFPFSAWLDSVRFTWQHGVPRRTSGQ